MKCPLYWATFHERAFGLPIASNFRFYFRCKVDFTVVESCQATSGFGLSLRNQSFVTSYDTLWS